MARIRVVTLNMEQDHKRWKARRELVAEQLVALEPDVVALNEVCVPLQTARWLQRVVEERLGVEYTLVQQTKPNSLAGVEDGAYYLRRLQRDAGEAFGGAHGDALPAHADLADCIHVPG